MARKIRHPKADQAIYDALARMFRRREIYSFSYEGGVWTTWFGEADWNATERNGSVRDPKAAAAGHGPFDWEHRADLLKFCKLDAPTKRLTKPQLVTRLNAMRDKLPAEAVALLDAA